MPASELQPSTHMDLTPTGLERAAGRMLALPQVECPLRHHFAEGVCVRELTLPAGTVVLGHIHRFADLNIMLTGRLTLLNEDGSLTELKAPQTFVGRPGQKIAYIHETVVWQNVWPLAPLPEEQRGDIEAIENFYLDKSPALARHMEQSLAVERLAREADRESFAEFLQWHELPAEDVRRISEGTADQIPFPAGSWKVRVGPSAIEGRGLLATAPFAAGEVIAPARIGGKRTPAGRYTNHAKEPNAEIVSSFKLQDSSLPAGTELVLVAVRDIAGAHGGQPGEEITVNYEQVLQANHGLAAELAKRKGKLLCQQP